MMGEIVSCSAAAWCVHGLSRRERAVEACGDTACTGACGMWPGGITSSCTGRGGGERSGVRGVRSSSSRNSACGLRVVCAARRCGDCAGWRACPTVACVSQLGVFQGRASQGHNVHIYALSVDYVALRSSQIVGSDGEVERK